MASSLLLLAHSRETKWSLSEWQEHQSKGSHMAPLTFFSRHVSTKRAVKTSSVVAMSLVPYENQQYIQESRAFLHLVNHIQKYHFIRYVKRNATKGVILMCSFRSSRETWLIFLNTK